MVDKNEKQDNHGGETCNLILEKKIKKNVKEMKLLVKMYEMTWKTMEDDEPPEDVKRAYLIAKDFLEDEENCV